MTMSLLLMMMTKCYGSGALLLIQMNHFADTELSAAAAVCLTMINTLVTSRRRTLHNYTCFICCKLQTRLSSCHLLPCCFTIDGPSLNPTLIS